MKTVKIGTRGSALALVQAHLTESCIQEMFPDLHVEICVIKTVGDRDRVRSLVSFGGQGVFVKEIEEALLDGSVDLAVHSLKDVPDSMDERLELSGFLKREDFRDVLVAGGKKLDELKKGALVGTGSPRRVLQLKTLRPDIRCVNLRGNLPSRIEKVESGELDGILLGAAGICRLGKTPVISEYFSVDQITPAIGQGIVALQSLKENGFAKKIAEAISDKPSVTAARAERRWMNLLGGGCRVPMGAVLEQWNSGFRFSAFLAEAQTGNSLRLSRLFSEQELESSGTLESFAREFAEACREKGIPLPSDVSSAEAIAEFWNREH